VLFITPPTTAEHIRAFCARFNEGIRVEYKANFDENVRRNLPKVLSSFANSLGGVLILGITADNGVPRVPIEGFEPPERDEIPLTIENICLQNINPAVFPRVTEIPSDVPRGRFVVVEIDESAEAPHAIENSTRVYVRTGNAANPFELADVDSLIELLRRRENPLQTRRTLLEKAHSRFFTPDDLSPQVHVSVCPVFPKNPLCSVMDCWNFLYNTPYRGGRFFPRATLRRIENGAASFGNGESGEVNNHGLVLGRKIIESAARGEHRYLQFRDVFHLCVRVYWCAARVLETVGYRGNVTVEIRLVKMLRQSLPFLPWEGFEAAEFTAYDAEISATQILPAEHLRSNALANVQELFVQLCWPLWQSEAEFPDVALREYIGQTLDGMALR
jgi:Putative DNA-binding domain